MGNVWDAMKKQNEERGSAGPSKPASPENRPAETGSSAADRSGARTPDGTGYSSVLVAYHEPGGKIAEQYRSFRTNLLARTTQSHLYHLVTSAEAGEGKTVTCLNLAFVLAELREKRVLVIDGDLRRSKLTQMIAAQKTPGLTEYLRGTHSLAEIIQPTVYPNLQVISSGNARREEMGDLLSRLQTSDVLADLRQKYDCVLVDTPAVNAVSGAVVIGRIMDEALMVVWGNKTSRESFGRALHLLQAADIKVAGLFFTHQKEYIPYYSSYYYYHKES